MIKNWEQFNENLRLGTTNVDDAHRKMRAARNDDPNKNIKYLLQALHDGEMKFYDYDGSLFQTKVEWLLKKSDLRNEKEATEWLIDNTEFRP